MIDAGKVSREHSAEPLSAPRLGAWAGKRATPKEHGWGKG